MRVTLDIHVSSDSLKAARVELARQYAAMRLRYPDMQLAGKISGAEAERRLSAQHVALEAVAALMAAARQEEYATAQFGPRGDADD